MTGEDLEPIAPAEAVEWYLEHRKESVRMSTRDKHRYALTAFVEWAEESEITNLNSLSGRQLMAFKTWRKNRTDLENISLNGTLSNLRVFLDFCEDIEAVAPGIADRVPTPNVPSEDEVNDFVPPDEHVEAVREYYGRYEYASRRHTEHELVAEVGNRLGAIRAIDLGDVDHDERRIYLRHRPEGTDDYGTPLKNGSDSERYINVSDDLYQLICEYIDNIRSDVVDEYDREPLFTTDSGRPEPSTIRRDFYKMTRPCEFDQECPHGREVTDCDAAKINHNADDCPSVYTTHPLRKWSIMHQLDAGVRKEVLSDRVDVSVPVLKQHYDQRSEDRKSRRRREELEEHLNGY
jgi:site-specific recombinase XerD